MTTNPSIYTEARELLRQAYERAGYTAAMDVVMKSKTTAQMAVSAISEALIQRDTALARIAELEGALRPFAMVASTFSVSIAPDGIDDGLTIGAYISVMPQYEARLSTSDFSRAAQLLKGNANAI